MITGTAALEHDLIEPNAIFNDTGVLKIDIQTPRNAGDAVYGPIDMSDAFKVSSTSTSTTSLKAKTLEGPRSNPGLGAPDGLGERSGIDLPSEVEGLIPTPAWRNRLYHEGLTDRPWTAGDNINLAVGQGDLQANPLQMAVAHAPSATAERSCAPPRGPRESVTGAVLEEVLPPPRREIPISDADTADDHGRADARRDGGQGHSYGVFGNFPSRRGQDGHGRARGPARPVLVRRARSCRRSADRGRGHARARRIRSRHRRSVAARILEKYFKLPITPVSNSSSPGA